ncbi:Transposase [Thermoplasmatales archaeon]|nr:Transposase [Thermoplasmatales archaeon]
MTYTRKIIRGENTYLYRVTSFRDRDTGKVRQRSEYQGKEIIKDNVKTIQKPRNRIQVRRVLESAPYILYRNAENFGINDDFITAMQGLTNMREAARRIIMLAASHMTGTFGSLELHTGIRDSTVKEERDLVDFIGSKDPDVISILERAMSQRIVKAYGSHGIVYDLSAVRYLGSENDLAMYGHYYRTNGGNREINFVLAVTREGGIPVHHRIMPGNIVSVSTVGAFAMELRDLGISTIMVVMDRGFYSTQNIKDLKDYSLIGAIPASLKMYHDLLAKSGKIENSRNYIQYHKETVFFREHRIDSIRYIVYFSAQSRADRMQAFYSHLSDIEGDLKALQGKRFDSEQDMMHTAISATGDMARYFDLGASEGSLTYRLKHNAIQARTNRMGFFILFTNTMIGADEILRIYREKDVVEKAFMHSRPSMQPVYARTEEGTRARIFLSILGYSMMRMIAHRCDLSYEETERILSGIKEVVYSNGSHAPVELTKEQKSVLQKSSIEL